MKPRKQMLFGFLTLLLVFLLSACGEDESEKYQPDPQLDAEVENFEYTNQDGQSVSLDELSDGHWIASFIFTNCETVCLPMMSNMTKIQSEAKEKDIDIDFVSFTVDPANDDPETLMEYGESYNVDFANWQFLTGYDQEEIESFAADSFKALVAKVDGYDQVNHGTSFYIVSPEGQVLNSFSGTKEEEYGEILDYVNHYQNEQ